MNTLYYITEEISDVYMSLYEAAGDGVQNQQPQDPNAVAPQDPNAVAPQDPNAVAPQDPNAVAPQDPNAVAPQDPNAVAPQDPNAVAPQDPNAVADGTDAKLDPIKKYILLIKIVELKQYLELYSANIESSKDVKQLIKFISVVIDFYDIFDYISLKDLSENIMRESAKLIKHRDSK